MTDQAIKTIDDLKLYLYSAMQLEHATIPPYLTALYSIHPGTNAAATHVLRTIAVEEMLHLTIAANLLNAIGGEPDLTASNFVPGYPSPLPDGEKDFEVGLGRFSPQALQTFLKIERPDKPLAAPTGKRLVHAPARRYALVSSPLHKAGAVPADQSYYSIGAFYQEIIDGIGHLHEQYGRDLFSGDPKKQITSEYYYSGGGVLPAVTDITSAGQAIRLIIEQGEGDGGGIYDHGNELAHFYRFQELEKGRYYKKGDQRDHPTGPRLEASWDAVYPIKPNARIADYTDPELRDAAIAFNEFYRGYLGLLTQAYNGERELLTTHAVPMMFEIRNRMTQLMRVPLDDGSGLHAAPTFEIGEEAAQS